MKKVVIRCISNYSLINKYHIIILDKRKNLILNEYTKCSKVELYLNKGVYKIIITPLDLYSSVLQTTFIVNQEINNFKFCFAKSDDSLKITVILVDNYYNNLPIERGKIILWQDHIQ